MEDVAALLAGGATDTYDATDHFFIDEDRDGDLENYGHGTECAGIISGIPDVSRKGVVEERHRGVTECICDSFNVYTSPGYVQKQAIPRAVAAVLHWGDSVAAINVGIPPDQVEWGLELEVLVDDLYSAGVPVIAPSGNTGRRSQSTYPGRAHKAVSVGGYFSGSAVSPEGVVLHEAGDWYGNFPGFPDVGTGFGRTSDGRIKPDVAVPTDTKAPSAISDTEYRTMDASSGALPYGGAFAVLMVDLLVRTGLEVMPGHVYASMIALGDANLPPFRTEKLGSGRIGLPGLRDQLFVGRAELRTSGARAHVDVDAPGLTRGESATLCAAVWWPEDRGARHEEVSLQLVRRGGPTLARSSDETSVWQRVSTAVVYAPAPGLYRLEAIAESVRSPREIFVALVVSPFRPSRRL